MASGPDPRGLATGDDGGADDDLDRMPLINRKRMLLSTSLPPSSPPLPRSPADCTKSLSREGLQEWPRLPRGVKFDPTDEELLWHLLAKVGKGEVEPHPFIHVFINSLVENDRIACTHPHELPGVKQDGSVSYFFHRTFKAYKRSSRKRQKINGGYVEGVCWQEVGNTEPIIVNRIHQGSKKILVLCISMLNGVKHKKTNWVMHSYHLGTGDTKEGEIVVSKIFYEKNPLENDKNQYGLPLNCVGTVIGGVKPVFGPEKVGFGPHRLKHHSESITMLSSDQVAAARQSVDKENNAHAMSEKLGSHDNDQTKYPNNVKIEPHFILASEQLANDSTNGTLLQKQSYMNDCEVEKSISCTLGWDRVSSGVMKVEPEKCRHAREDILPRLSNDLVGEIDECSPCRSHGENHSANLRSAPVEIYMSGVGKDILKSMSTSFSCSPDNGIIGSPFVVGQFSPIPVIYQNKSSQEYKCSQAENVLSNQTCILEAIPLIAREENECVNGSSEPLSIAEPLEGVKAEHLEEGCVNNNIELSVTLDSSIDRLCSPMKFQGASLCSSNGKICLDNFPSMTSKLEKNQEDDCKYSGEAFGSDGNLSRIGLGQSLTYLNGDIQHLDSVASTCAIDMKPETLGEGHNNLYKAIAEPSRSNGITENTCTCMSEANFFQNNHTSGGRNSQENPAEQLIICNKVSLFKDLQLDLNVSEINVTSASGSWNTSFPDKSCIATQCSTEADGVHASVVPTGSNLNDLKDAVSFHQTSLHQELTPRSIHHHPELVLSSLPITVKEEDMESSSLSPGRNSLASFPNFDNSGDYVKKELLCELSRDALDDIPLIARIKMPIVNCDSNLHSSNDMTHSQQASLDTPTNSNTSHFSLRRKSKKTATDSVEKALQEDAPGLLQVLLDKGIAMDEIKLYGDMEVDDAIEISPTEDNFEELETVICKLFSDRPSLLKLSLLRNIKGPKPVYCLACLISLVEQTRYLRFRDSPVEWGWCRDLQSFIFVFKRHNRIVLERPEYGYATYFFELVESLPIDWQIKRLVIAMKLSSCGRTTLIENRSLLIGQDLSEGEAQVLEAYGWEPNTGLGTMLNYCGRVMHDKKNERYSSEWRSKIGRLLMAGHDGGRTVSTSIPKKVVEYMGGKIPEIHQGAQKSLEYVGFQYPEIKLET